MQYLSVSTLERIKSARKVGYAKSPNITCYFWTVTPMHTKTRNVTKVTRPTFHTSGIWAGDKTEGK